VAHPSRAQHRWIKSKLNAVDSQAGDPFVQNLPVSAAIVDNSRIGVASYGLWQRDGTRVDE